MPKLRLNYHKYLDKSAEGHCSFSSDELDGIHMPTKRNNAKGDEVCDFEETLPQVELFDEGMDSQAAKNRQFLRQCTNYRKTTAISKFAPMRPNIKINLHGVKKRNAPLKDKSSGRNTVRNDCWSQST